MLASTYAASGPFQSYYEKERGGRHKNDGHVEEEEEGYQYDTGILVRYGEDENGNGTGLIKAQHSERRYVVVIDARNFYSVDINNASWDQVYSFEPVYDKNKEMWFADGLTLQYFDDEDGDDAHDDDAVGGVVTRYFEDRGFGFIEADDSGATPSADEYFFHISQVDGDSIAEGDWVYFYESFDDAKDRYYATDVIVANNEKEE